MKQKIIDAFGDGLSSKLVNYNYATDAERKAYAVGERFYEKYVKDKFFLLEPKAPLNRIIREGDLGEPCSECGSSMKYKLNIFSWFAPLFIPTGCIQEQCVNFYKTK